MKKLYIFCIGVNEEGEPVEFVTKERAQLPYWTLLKTIEYNTPNLDLIAAECAEGKIAYQYEAAAKADARTCNE